MTSVPIIFASFGSFLVVLSIVGHYIQTKYWQSTKKVPVYIRIVSGVVGVALITISIWLFFESKPAPPITPPNEKQEAPQINTLDIKGKVVDIFDNPREDVIVIIRGIQRYAITDKYGEYHISNVPFNNIITLEAYYGTEKDTINASLNKGNIGGIENISEHLILNPIEIEATLCEYVDGDYSIEGEFERENPRIPLDSLRVDEEQNLKEIWCFVIVYGPLEYQIGKNTEIRYEWYYNKEIQRRPFEQQVGFNPHGWRTRASKKVWKGEWELIIKTKHKELVKIQFEIN